MLISTSQLSYVKEQNEKHREYYPVFISTSQLYSYTTDGNKQKEKHTERISNKNIHITAALWLKKETHKRLSNVNISP